MTKFRVLVLCFPYFVDHSIICIDSPNIYIYIYIYNTYKDNYNSLCTLCTYGILSLNSFQTLDMLSFHLIFITRKHNLFNYKKKKKKKTPFAPLSDQIKMLFWTSQFVSICFDCHVFLTMKSWDVLISQNDQLSI